MHTLLKCAFVGEKNFEHILLNYAFYEMMWKNDAEPDRPPMTIQYGACTLHAG
jgi:hypothetical protein